MVRIEAVTANSMLNIISLITVLTYYVTMRLIFPVKRSEIFPIFITALATAVIFGASYVMEIQVTIVVNFIRGLLYLPIHILLFRGRIVQKLFVFFANFLVIAFIASIVLEIVGIFALRGSYEFFRYFTVISIAAYAVYTAFMVLYWRRIFSKLFVVDYTSVWGLYTFGVILSFGVMTALRITLVTGFEYGMLMLFVFFSCIVLCGAVANTYGKTISNQQVKSLQTSNAALEKLSRTKTEYLAEISHKTKTPLTIISVHIQQAAELFDESGHENETIRDSLRRAGEEILRIGRITEHNLRLAVTQESQEKMTIIDIAKLLVSCAEIRRRVIEKNGNALVINIPDNLPHVFSNADYITQVADNILANANRHTKGGEISVSAEADENNITVTIADNGTGISPALLPDIFKRGVSGSGGTGIGLPLCKNIIESHGGMIWAESERGKGTAVIFTLPLLLCGKGEES